MIFIFILIFGVLFLFVNLRQMAPGNRGSIAAGLIVVLLPICFIFRERYWACVGQAFLSVWLCEALLLYIAWWIVRGVRRGLVRRPLPHRASVTASRVIFAVTVAVSLLMCAAGYQHEANYRVHPLEVNVSASRLATQSVPPSESGGAVTALFFTDLHINPLFDRRKLERMIHTADSVKPDLILFGGDFSDIMDSAMSALDYDLLVQKLAASARVGAFAVNGNHEGYMERSGSDIDGWLRHAGFTVLDDSTVCTSVACITGRTDTQVARVREVERKSLASLAPGSVSAHRLWILLDHQPRGIEPDHGGRLPDLALSGHTHNGQFFPGTVIIDFVWRLAYGFGELDGVPWLVSSGVGSWGPPVRVGSDTEMWVIKIIRS